jgi:hypothetical protein
MPRTPEDPKSREQEESIRSILDLMTPAEILTGSDFSLPEAIHPDEYCSFDKLLAARDRIRRLELVPIKDDEGYAFYHAQSKESLVRMVEQYFVNGPIVSVRNAFPYALPTDVGQWLMWLKDPSTSRNVIAERVKKMLERRNLTMNDLILFERPLHTKSKLVRGTFPEYRHIHVWLRER